MTAVAMPMPALLDPPPPPPPPAAPAPGGGGREPGLPAPVATMLAVLARVASHAGDPLSATVTGPGHVITVNVADPDSYAQWRTELDAGDTTTRDDVLGPLAQSRACLHGWSLVVQIAASS